MERIVADDRLAERLAIRITPVEVVHASGRLIGVFQPASQLPEDHESDEPEPTLEELERIMTSSEPTYTTDEVLTHLRKLG